MAGVETVLDGPGDGDEDVSALCDRVEETQRTYESGSGTAEELATALADLAEALDRRGLLEEKTTVLDRLADLHGEHPEPAVREAYARAVAPYDNPVWLSPHVERGDEAYLVDLRDRLQAIYEEYSEPPVAAALAEVYLRANDRDYDAVAEDRHARIRDLYSDHRTPALAGVLTDVELDLLGDSVEELEACLDDVEDRYDRFTGPEMASRLLIALFTAAERYRIADNSYEREQAERRLEDLDQEYEDDDEVARAYGAVLDWRVLLSSETGDRERLLATLDELADLAAAEPERFTGAYAVALAFAVETYGETADFEDVEAFLDELASLHDDSDDLLARQWYATGLAEAAAAYVDAGRFDEMSEAVADLESLHDATQTKTVRRALADALTRTTNADELAIDVDDAPVRERAAEHQDRLSDLQAAHGDVADLVARGLANQVVIEASAGEFDAADATLTDLREHAEAHDAPAVRSEYARALARDAECHADSGAEGGDPDRVGERRQRLESLSEAHEAAGVAEWLAVVVAAHVRVQTADDPDLDDAGDIDLDYERDRVRSLAETHPEAGDRLGEACAEIAYRALEAEAASGGHDDDALEDRLDDLTSAYDDTRTERAGWLAARGVVAYNRAMQEGPGEPYTDLSIKAGKAETAFENHRSERIGELVFAAHAYDAFESIDQGDTLITLRTKLDNAEEFYEGARGVAGVDLDAAYAEFLADVGERVAPLSMDRADEIHRKLESLAATTEDGAVDEARRRVETALADEFPIPFANPARVYTDTLGEFVVVLGLVGLGVTGVLPIADETVFLAAGGAGLGLAGYDLYKVYSSAKVYGANSDELGESSLLGPRSRTNVYEFAAEALLMAALVGVADAVTAESMLVVEEVWTPLVDATAGLLGPTAGLGAAALAGLVGLWWFAKYALAFRGYLANDGPGSAIASYEGMAKLQVGIVGAVLTVVLALTAAGLVPW